tara:strand:+ start:14499 stop:14978 length:480 start_codon:yes stop_codon:yes gene_type:complete
MNLWFIILYFLNLSFNLSPIQRHSPKKVYLHLEKFSEKYNLLHIGISFEDDVKVIRYDFRPFYDDIESYETTNKNIVEDSIIVHDNIWEHLDIPTDFEKKNVYWGKTNKSFKEIASFEKSLHKKYILCYYDCRHYVREFTTWALNKSTPVWYLDEIWND